ncbi:MAG: DUF2177 family protein [Bacilli bacterium]|nr:DUF2177 family protein [Bacilli bacterium]
MKFKLIKMYLIALVIFVIIDGIWLGFIAKDLYRKELGHLLASNPNWTAAIIFYLLFLVGLVYFVINPGIEKESIMTVVISGALFGLLTYATYDLTNLATLKEWPLKITIIDLIWGTSLSTIVSTATYYFYMLFK